MADKTDKIRERIEKIKQIADQSSGNALSHQLKKKEVPVLLDALEAVVEELEHSVQITDEGEPAVLFAGELLDIIANELDVEEE